MSLYNALAHAEGVALIPSGAKTADANGTAVDVTKYEGVALAVLNCAAATAGTNPTMDVKLQHSDDNVTFADVTGGAFTQVTATDSLQVLKFNIADLKKYVRGVIDIGGTSSPSFPLGLSLIALPKVG